MKAVSQTLTSEDHSEVASVHQVFCTRALDAVGITSLARLDFLVNASHTYR